MQIFANANRPALYFLLLPLAVAIFGWGPAIAGLAVLAGVLWKWSLGFRKLAPPPAVPEPMQLHTIGASHIVEKARWHLDRLGVPYEEHRAGGILSILLTARSVPRLSIPDGVSSSVIGDSTEILRYLWGRYGASHPKEAAFLAPTAESLELERRLNAYALDVRRYVYFQLLPEREVMLRLWGADDPTLPAWQWGLMRTAYPVLRGFVVRGTGVNQEQTQKSIENVQAFLGEMEERLASGGPLLRRGPLHSIDFQFAALSALWVQPPEFGGAFYADHYRISLEDWPPHIRTELEGWHQRYPNVTAYVRKLYAEERTPRPQLSL